MGNAISFRLNQKCESDRKILAWLDVQILMLSVMKRQNLLQRETYKIMSLYQIIPC